MVYKCHHCGKEYKSEKWFKNHKCTYMKKEESFNEIAYNVWLMLCKLYHIKLSKDPKKQYLKSSYTKFCQQFADWIVGINIIDLEAYINYVMRFQYKPYHWINDKLYRQFLNEYIENEPLEQAIKRSEKYLFDNGLNMSTISSNRLQLLVDCGQISKKYLEYYYGNKRNEG